MPITNEHEITLRWAALGLEDENEVVLERISVLEKSFKFSDIHGLLIRENATFVL